MYVFVSFLSLLLPLCLDYNFVAQTACDEFNIAVAFWFGVFCVHASGFGLSVTPKMGGGILILFDTNVRLYETVSRTIIILIPHMVWSNKEVKGGNCMCPDS